jgi:hypothetical protein
MLTKDSNRLLFGQSCLTSEIGGKKCSFFPQNGYSSSLEAYKNINESIAEMLKKSNSEAKTDILVDLGCENGVVGTLATEKNYKKLYSIHYGANTIDNFKYNLQQNGIDVDEYAKFYKNYSRSMRHVRSIVEENGEDSRICFVWQSNSTKIDDYQRKDSRKNLLVVHFHNLTISYQFFVI